MANEAFSGPSLTGNNAGDPNLIKMTFNRGSIKYDNPFLDMTSTYIPVTIKAMLRFVAAFALGDGLISQCIIKMAEYPITSLIYNDGEEGKLKDDKGTKWWKDLLENQLQVMRLIRECGMNYYAYGNSIVSMHFPFRRQIQCKKCQKWWDVTALKDTIFRNFKFMATCTCGHKGDMEAKDIPTKEVSKLKIVQWDIAYIDIKYNNISGDHFYYYTVPASIRVAIMRGDMEIVNSTRLEVIEAVKRNRQVRLHQNNLFHLKRSAPQYLIPNERGWGIPLIMPVMKDIFHIRILKKGNEMIAFDHIVPMRMLFPSTSGDVSPHMTQNLGSWRSKIEDELLQWRKDPNRISIVPMPVGQTTFGGDGKLLMLTSEIKMIEDNIIIGMGVIPEIIRGGASWSGSNVSLRIIENTFMNHRSDCHGLLDFIQDKVSTYFEKPKIKVKMSDFKMADDLSKKQLIMNNAQLGTNSMFSETTITKEFGFDPKVEYENRMEELKRRVELKTKEAEGMAEANGAGSIIQALYQADAQIENQNRMEMHAKNQADDVAKQNDKARAEAGDAVITDLKEKGAVGVSIPQLIFMLTQRFARLSQSDPMEFKIRLMGLKQSMSPMFDEVYRNLKELKLIGADLIESLKVDETNQGQVQDPTLGGESAEDAPDPVAQGLPASEINAIAATPKPEGAPVRPLPEQLPPRGQGKI